MLKRIIIIITAVIVCAGLVVGSLFAFTDVFKPNLLKKIGVEEPFWSVSYGTFLKGEFSVQNLTEEPGEMSEFTDILKSVKVLKTEDYEEVKGELVKMDFVTIKTFEDEEFKLVAKDDTVICPTLGKKYTLDRSIDGELSQLIKKKILSVPSETPEE